MLNVRDFGARGVDEVLDDGTHANDRDAIQAALDEATNRARHPGGATIYFPEGRYPIRGEPLQLPRLPSDPPLRSIVLKGDGWMNTTITTGSHPTAEPRPPNPLIQGDVRLLPGPDGPVPNRHEGIGYVFEDLQLGSFKDHEILHWDVDISSGEETHRVLEGFFNRVFFRSERSAGVDDPLVYVHRGRVRFSQCAFSLRRDLGVCVGTRNSSGITMQDCHTIYGRGALIDARGGAELLILNCRSEGAVGRPAWKFTGVTNVTLVNAANEGHLEDPSVFSFEDCSDVVLINPSIATGQPLDASGRHADGIRLVGCTNCHIVGATPSKFSFADRGNRKAKLLRVTDSKYVRAYGLRTDIAPPARDVAVERSSYTCIEIFGTSSKQLERAGDCAGPRRTMWASPAAFFVDEGTDPGGTVRISRGLTGDAVKVTGRAAGSFWIVLPLTLPAGVTLRGVGVQYQLSAPETRIVQVRLTEQNEPPSARIVHDDTAIGGHAPGTEPSTYVSDVGGDDGYAPAGAVSLSLKVQLSDPSHHVLVGALRLDVE